MGKSELLHACTNQSSIAVISLTSSSTSSSVVLVSAGDGGSDSSAASAGFVAKEDALEAGDLDVSFVDCVSTPGVGTVCCCCKIITRIKNKNTCMFRGFLKASLSEGY